ncbi:MAG: hypothetical protein WC879_00095 [Melioribacteraceae bacterium]
MSELKSNSQFDYPEDLEKIFLKNNAGTSPATKESIIITEVIKNKDL